jgi:hypothetical protein
MAERRSLADIGFPAMPGGKLSELVKSAWEAMKVPGKAYNDGMTPDEMIKAGNDFAMTMGAGGSLVPKPGNSLGIFGGRLAKTANLEKLAEAEKFEKAGINADTIWKATGWGRGKDGKWRFEINDKDATLNLKHDALDPVWEKNPNYDRNRGGYEYLDRWPSPTLGEAFDHPALFEAYPDLKNIQLGKETSGHRGSYAGGTITLDDASDKHTLLHELQHAIQRKEDFAKGSGSGRIANDLTSNLGPDHPIVKKLAERIGPKGERSSIERRLYKHAAGEVEARNTANRMFFSNLQRAMKSPWTTEDVPRNLQLPFGYK